MSAAWVVITTDTIKAYLVAAQVEALQTRALGSGQSDPFDDAMPDTAAEVRNAIENGGYMVSATANSVPPELRKDTSFLIIEAMQARLMLTLTSDQIRCIERAHAKLERIAEGELAPTEPTDPQGSNTQSGGDFEIVESTTLTHLPANLDGLH